MPWATYSELFMSGSGRLRNPVPRSCIESAEYVIQCIASRMLLEWSANQARDPHVEAHFGNGVTIDITAKENFQDSAEGLTDYPFTGLPQVGEGIICLNKTKTDLYYNMHLGAVIARSGDRALLTNMMEAPHIAVMKAVIEPIEIGTADEFRSQNLAESRHFALGLLRAKPRAGAG